MRSENIAIRDHISDHNEYHDENWFSYVGIFTNDVRQVRDIWESSSVWRQEWKNAMYR